MSIVNYDIDRSGMTTVQPNQIWHDNDARSAGRSLRVIRTDETHALCEVLTNSDESQRQIDSKQPGHSYVPRDMRGKTTRIALKRFKPTSTGYRLTTPRNPEDGHETSEVGAS